MISGDIITGEFLFEFLYFLSWFWHLETTTSFWRANFWSSAICLGCYSFHIIVNECFKWFQIKLKPKWKRTEFNLLRVAYRYRTRRYSDFQNSLCICSHDSWFRKKKKLLNGNNVRWFFFGWDAVVFVSLYNDENNNNNHEKVKQIKYRGSK